MAKKQLIQPDNDKSQEIVVNLVLKKITDDTDKVKGGVREIRKVVFGNDTEGVSLTLKEPKVSHFLRKWDKRVFESDSEIILTLSVPRISQKLITDYGDELGKIKEEDSKQEGNMSIADALKEAGKIVNKDASFISAYLRHIRKEFIVQSLELRTAAVNIDALCGELNGLRIMVDRLFMNQESVKVGEKLFVHGSWEIPIGSKIRRAFDKIERKTIESLFGDDTEISRSEHARELTKAIEKALEDQKELLESQNKRLRKENEKLVRETERAKGKNEAIEGIEKALHQGTGHVSDKEESTKE